MPTRPARCPRDPAAPRHAAGVTLIELIVVIAIAAILVAIGLPNLTTYFSTNRVATAGNEFMTALQLARSEAIRRSGPVGLQTLATAGSGDWGASGWVMFADVNGDGAYTSAADGAPIRSGAALQAPVTLFGSNATYGTTILFDATGRSINGAGTFVVCYGGVLAAGNQPRSRAVAVAASGRMRFAEPNSSGVPVGDAGTALTSCTNP